MAQNLEEQTAKKSDWTLLNWDASTFEEIGSHHDFVGICGFFVLLKSISEQGCFSYTGLGESIEALNFTR